MIQTFFEHFLKINENAINTWQRNTDRPTNCYSFEPEWRNNVRKQKTKKISTIANLLYDGWKTPKTH